MTIGSRLHDLRIDLVLTMEELGQKVGVGKGTIKKYENGVIKNIPSDKIEALADALETTPEYLMGWTENEHSQHQEHKEVPEPDYELAATKAAEILVQLRVSAAPVLPLQILNSMPGVLVRAFTELADNTGLDRNDLASWYGAESQDAVTFTRTVGGRQRYIVAYNQRMPFYMLQMSLARELAFIVLGTADVRQDDARMQEALTFTRHLLCPRPLVRAMMDEGLPLTVESVGSLTGCYGRCLAGIRETPATHVAAGLNRLIRQQFAPFVENLAQFEMIAARHDDSPEADFGTFMDGYEE